MKYTPEEVLLYLKEEDVKFVRMSFCDPFGRQKNVAIMADELPRAFEYGQFKLLRISCNFPLIAFISPI